ncbi:hypothetical protein Cgig2_015498 [Carnegiea gigantea]|uniref:Uncharacterized protein n=1 Tax=Carnegiea gigantea TaxID=171969 RepID=A0A9Q1KG62_9CARY|nr:hypothetical protein Cgig2_015498 [Carnegiea gigantea]
MYSNRSKSARSGQGQQSRGITGVSKQEESPALASARSRRRQQTGGVAGLFQREGEESRSGKEKERRESSISSGIARGFFELITLGLPLALNTSKESLTGSLRRRSVELRQGFLSAIELKEVIFWTNAFSLLLIVVQFAYYNIEKGKMKEGCEDKNTQFHWSKPMLKELLRFLADEANPTHEKYLNKKIDMYDEIAIVVGKDVARGSGVKSFDDGEI